MNKRGSRGGGRDDSTRAIFESYVEEAVRTPFSGWDFDYVTSTSRMAEAPLTWNYYNVVHFLKVISKAMLDLGTGGGEVLSRFQPLPKITVATEQYKPNVQIARDRLEPLGVRVVYIEEEESPPYNANLPFDDESFDLVINRHEAYYPPELMRILKPGGFFITQQVGNTNWQSLLQFFLGEIRPASHWNLKSAVDELETAGFDIIRQEEDFQFCRFYDVGAVIYHLKAIPWAIPDFSVEKYKEKLWKLHLDIMGNGFYDTQQHRFLVVARKELARKVLNE